MINPLIRNMLAVLAGMVVFTLVNTGLVYLGPYVFPLPAGADLSSPEAFASSVPLFKIQHFVFPFLGHALGTLSGAYTGARIATRPQMTVVGVIGGVALFGGIMNAYHMPAPIWFEVFDLFLAYLPMAWLGGKLAN